MIFMIKRIGKGRGGKARRQDQIAKFFLKGFAQRAEEGKMRRGLMELEKKREDGGKPFHRLRTPAPGAFCSRCRRESTRGTERVESSESG